MATQTITIPDETSFVSGTSDALVYSFTLQNVQTTLSVVASVQPSGVSATGTLTLRQTGSPVVIASLTYTETVATQKSFPVFTPTAGVYELYGRIANQQHAFLVTNLTIADDTGTGGGGGEVIPTTYTISGISTLARVNKFRRNRHGLYEIEKYRDSIEDYTFDIRPQLGSTETVSSYEFVIKGAGNLKLLNNSLSSNVVYARFSGTENIVTLKVTTSTGRVIITNYWFSPTFLDPETLSLIISDYGKYR